MPRIKRILAATDLNPGTDVFMEAARQLAVSFGCEVILLDVIPAIAGSPVSPAKLKEVAERQLKEIRATFFRDITVTHTITTFGSPLGLILEYSTQHEADMIVIGAGAKGPEKKFQIGVLAEQIIRYSPQPVWVAKQALPHPLDRILCPVDFSDPSRHALSLAITLASVFKAELTVLTVVENLSNIYPGRPLVMPEDQGVYRDERKAEFDAFLREFDFEGLSWKKIIREGEPDRQILGLAAEQGCQVIVMGSEGRTGLSLMLLGSVAEKVVRELPCSVVTVKAAKEQTA